MRLLAADPGTRRAEVLLLGYTPLWIAAVALVQASGCLARWGDTQHLALGVGLALPLWLAPLLLRHRYLFQAVLFVTILSFLQCYFGSVLFFESLGMQYHFHVTVLLNGTPLFLYPMTVAYFASYFVMMQVAWRAFRMGFPRAPRAAVVLAAAVLSYAVAFGETFFMANNALRAYFSYADKHRTLAWGSLCYGTLFFVTLPLFYRIHEEQRPTRQIVWNVLAANTVIMLCYEVYRKMLG